MREVIREETEKQSRQCIGKKKQNKTHFLLVCATEMQDVCGEMQVERHRGKGKEVPADRQVRTNTYSHAQNEEPVRLKEGAER